MHIHRAAQSYVFWQAALCFAFVMLLVTSVWHMNQEAAQSFSIETLTQERNALAEEIDDLTWDISEARSLATVRNRAAELSLASPVEVSFLEVGFSTVAVAGIE